MVGLVGGVRAPGFPCTRTSVRKGVCPCKRLAAALARTHAVWRCVHPAFGAHCAGMFKFFVAGEPDGRVSRAEAITCLQVRVRAAELAVTESATIVTVICGVTLLRANSCVAPPTTSAR